MHRTGATEVAANVPRTIFPAVLFLCLAASGCGYGCYSGFWNGNSSGIAVSNTSCPLTKATGAVIVHMGVISAPHVASGAFLSPLTSPLSATPSALLGPSSNNVQHIFLTLRGIEAHPNMTTDEDSSSWQELAPDLAAHPVQLDLLAPLTVTGNSQSQDLSAGANVPATVPADEYRQLRLQILPRDPSADDTIPEGNACGIVSWNCIVFADHSVRPLEFAAAAELRILPERSADKIFRVLPSEVIHLSIEFDPSSSVLFPSSAVVRLVPAFRTVFRTSSPTATAQ